VENLYTNTKAGIISGLNAGNQTSEGFEFALNAGTSPTTALPDSSGSRTPNSYVKYSTLPNGQNVLAPINNDIQTYNAYTSDCAGHPSSDPSAACYTGIGTAAHTSNGVTSAPCYTPAGAPDTSCGAGDISKPYWNAPPQDLVDPNGKYLPYSVIPSGLGTGVNAYNYPYVATLVLNYKRDKFAVTRRSNSSPATATARDLIRRVARGDAHLDPRKPRKHVLRRPADRLHLLLALQRVQLREPGELPESGR